jgi:predicted ATP-dependent endonuclease of OLD family
MLLAFHFALVETERRIFELEQTKKRVEDFLSVINNLFRDKKLIMDSGRLTVVSDAGSSYPLTALSSGEQHLIVLLGRVLFPTDRYSLLRRKDAVRIVLLDEPEISLHLRWQFSVRDALKRFSESGQHRVFVATHSLHILGNLEHLEHDMSVEN